MRNFILALLAVVSVSLNAQTSIQFQSHVPVGTATNSKFSAYIADSSFNETSHLNSQAIWFVENVDVTVANGVINVTLENIPNSVFLTADRTNLFVYSYVNGFTVGRLPFQKVPYALVSEYT